MKKFLFMAALALALCFTACTNTARTQLRITAEQVNRQCPVELGGGVSLDNLRYDSDDNKLVISYGTDESISGIDNLRNAAKEQRRFIANLFMKNDNPEFVKQIIKAEAGIEVIFKGKVSGDSLSIYFPSEEIKEISTDDREVSDREQLESIVAISNAQCPIQIDGEALVLTQVALTDHSIEFRYSFDDNVYDFANSDEYEEALYEGLCEELRENDMQLELMKKLDIGVEYIMTPVDGGAPVIIGFANSRIQSI